LAKSFRYGETAPFANAKYLLQEGDRAEPSTTK